jgi:UDP-MurNAc hydroxylase
MSHQDTVVVTDPWFTERGAFLGSWFQWPLNHKYRTSLLELLGTYRNVFIYVSHSHGDHWDPDFARDTPANVTYIVPNFSDTEVEQYLRSRGIKVLALKDNVECELIENLLKVKLFITDVGINIDSAILVKLGDETFLNQNDCKINDRLSHIDSPITYYSVQFSGANWHPHCYEYPDKQKKRIANQKINVKIKTLLQAIKTLKPSVYLPGAGPAIFPHLDASWSLEDDNIFIHQEKLDRALRNRVECKVAYLRPGDELDKKTEKNSPIQPPTQAELQKMKLELGNEFLDKNVNFCQAKFREVLRERVDALTDIEFRSVPDIYFVWGDGPNQAIGVSLEEKRVLDTFDYREPYVKIRGDERYFGFMCERGFNWGDLALSMRASIDRQPDIFSGDVSIFLMSPLSRLRRNYLSTRQIKEERIIVRSAGGERFEIDRFCPHNGADLKFADIVGNCVICPRHGWSFGLEEGGCHAESGKTINAKKLL